MSIKVIICVRSTERNIYYLDENMTISEVCDAYLPVEGLRSVRVQGETMYKSQEDGWNSKLRDVAYNATVWIEFIPKCGEIWRKNERGNYVYLGDDA